MNPKQTRGYRNKNPGNIDHNPANRWQGLADPPIEDAPLNGGRPRFARFVSHEYGIRALALLLITYQDKHGLRSIHQVISRWAPGAENDTAAYVRHVAQLTGFGANDVLDLHTYAHLRPMVEAVITHELGGQPYAAETIDEGLRLAGVPKPVTTIREAAATGTGRGAIQGTVAAGAAGLVVALAPALDVVGRLPPWLGALIVVAVAGIVVTRILVRRKARATEEVGL